MSLGQSKMFSVSDQYADRVLVCDSRGMDWAVVVLSGEERHFIYGTESARGEGTRFFETSLENVHASFRPWLKKMLKPFNRKQQDEEHERQAA